MGGAVMKELIITILPAATILSTLTRFGNTAIQRDTQLQAVMFITALVFHHYKVNTFMEITEPENSGL